jgi:hypothetical protein
VPSYWKWLPNCVAVFFRSSSLLCVSFGLLCQWISFLMFLIHVPLLVSWVHL